MPDPADPTLADQESEFGVPIPGHILTPDRWTQTALKRWPEGPLDWQRLFQREARRIVEVGCGNARYTLLSALARPDCDHLATDILPLVIRYATRRGNQRGLTNTRFAVMDGMRLLQTQLSARSIDELHVYHPQPFYERHERKRRLFQPEFLGLVWNTLQVDGQLIVQTDHPTYWNYLERVLPQLFVLEGPLGPWPDAPAGRTRREILARQRGLPIFRGIARPRLDLTAAQVESIIKEIPRPLFNADRALIELDRLEASNTSAEPQQPQ